MLEQRSQLLKLLGAEMTQHGLREASHVLVQARDRGSVQQLLTEVRQLIRIDFEHQRDVAPIDFNEPRVA